MKYAIVYKYTPTDMFSGREYDPEYRTYITKDSADETRVMEVLRNSNEYELISKTPIPDDRSKLLIIVVGIINELLQKENCIFSLIRKQTKYDDYTEETIESFEVVPHNFVYVEEITLILSSAFKKFITDIFTDFGFTNVVFLDDVNTLFSVIIKG